MATKAEQLEKSQKVPTSMRDKADEVSESCKRGYEANLDDRTPHAYCFQLCDDGSAVALWANDKDGEVKIKAFSNLAEASKWSPRSELNGGE
jgi:hypothetical protein